MERWLENGDDTSKFLLAWQKVLIDAMHTPDGLDRLLTLLADDSEDATQMKSYSPSTTILDCTTIDRIYRFFRIFTPWDC